VIGCRQVYPAVALVPVWTYGPIYGGLTGRYLGEGWSPTRYLTVQVGSALDRAIRPDVT
jgi:hypothetical protein